MRYCCDPLGRITPSIRPFLIQRETVARSTFRSLATSDAFRYDFTYS